MALKELNKIVYWRSHIHNKIVCFTKKWFNKVKIKFSNDTMKAGAVAVALFGSLFYANAAW